MLRWDLRRANCLVWALFQRLMVGGSIGVARSSHPLLPRFVWVDSTDGKWYYAPLNPRKGWRAIPHAVWFRGRPRLISR